MSQNFELDDPEDTGEGGEGEIIQGYYLLRHLALFSKCANLCQNIKIFLANENPLVIEYSVGNLGNLLLALAPQIED